MTQWLAYGTFLGYFSLMSGVSAGCYLGSAGAVSQSTSPCLSMPLQVPWASSQGGSLKWVHSFMWQLRAPKVNVLVDKAGTAMSLLV